MRPKSKHEVCFPRPTSYEDSSCPGAFCSRGSHTEMQSAGGSHDSCGSPSWPRMVRLRIWGAAGEPEGGIEPPTCALRERKHAGRLSALLDFRRRSDLTERRDRMDMDRMGRDVAAKGTVDPVRVPRVPGGAVERDRR